MKTTLRAALEWLALVIAITAALAAGALVLTALDPMRGAPTIWRAN